MRFLRGESRSITRDGKNSLCTPSIFVMTCTEQFHIMWHIQCVPALYQHYLHLCCSSQVILHPDYISNNGGEHWAVWENASASGQSGKIPHHLGSWGKYLKIHVVWEKSCNIWAAGQNAITFGQSRKFAEHLGSLAESLSEQLSLCLKKNVRSVSDCVNHQVKNSDRPYFLACCSMVALFILVYLWQLCPCTQPIVTCCS